MDDKTRRKRPGYGMRRSRAPARCQRPSRKPFSLRLIKG